MPEGTKVHRAYRRYLKKGHSKSSAARLAQAETGQSLKTGRKPKRKSR